MQFFSAYVPNLRFNVYHDDLFSTSFKNVLTLYRGSSPRPIIQYLTTSNSGVNWIKIGDMPSVGNKVTKCSERITLEGARKSRYVKKGDIILSNSMSFGKPYILQIDGYIHDGWFVIREYQKYLDKDYLCQLLSSEVVQKQYKSTAAGGVVKNISSELVNSVKINIPSIREQKQIAHFLNKIDERIETQIKIIDALISQRKSIFLQHDLKIKKHELVINDLGKMNNGCNLSKEDITKSGKSCILYGELFTKYDHVVNNVISNTQKTNEKTLYSKKHNLVFPSSTTVDAFSLICPVSLNIEGVILGGDLFNIEIYPASNSDYLSYLINFKYKKTLSRYAKGTTIIHLHYEDIKNVKLQVACLEEQNKIARVMELITEKIDKENKLLELLKNQKAYLLDNLFI